MSDDAETMAIQNLYDRIIAVIDQQPANLQANAISNVLASFAVAAMATGQDPYDMARIVYKNSKEHIARNLKAQGLLTSLPKGATRQ